MKKQKIIKTTLKTLNDSFVDIANKTEINVPVQRKWIEEHRDLFPVTTTNEGRVYADVKLSELCEAYASVTHRIDIDVPVKRIWIRKWSSVFPMLTMNRTPQLSTTVSADNDDYALTRPSCELVSQPAANAA